MIKLEQIISRAIKIMGGDRRTARLEALIMAAYAAGQADRTKDIMITLADDMANDDHAAAIELINANY